MEWGGGGGGGGGGGIATGQYLLDLSDQASFCAALFVIRADPNWVESKKTQGMHLSLLRVSLTADTMSSRSFGATR
jgi:hypothetical protein